MSAQHTPGPWRIVPQTDARNRFVIRAPHPDYPGESSASVPIAGSVTEANARLIAAAPELLKALKDLLSCDGSDHFEEDGFHTLTPHAETVAQCVAAIAKATSP